MDEKEKKYEDMLNHTYLKDISDRMETIAAAIDRIENYLFGRGSTKDEEDK